MNGSKIQKAMAAAKRIIICCDGTWQSAVSGEKNSPSNVTRLARCFDRAGIDENGKEWQQVVWYDSGIGTTSGFLGKKFEGLLGAGIEGNVIEAYNFVALNYSHGDEILCFGFSRGAYTARSIAGLISDIGVCDVSKLNDFYKIWAAYKATEPGMRFMGSDAYFDYIDGVVAEDPTKKAESVHKDPRYDQDPNGPWATVDSRVVKVVGVFDTVGSLGMPSVMGFAPEFGSDKQKYHNVRMNRNVKHAFHALAIDEHREAFSPTLWHKSTWDTPTQEAIKAQRDVEKKAGEEWEKVKFDRKNTTKAQRDKTKSAYNQARTQLFHMEENIKPGSELIQVWFPGVHINVGGGSADSLKCEGDLEEMSNITFTWMLDHIRPHVSINEETVQNDWKARCAHIKAHNEELRQYQEHLAAESKKRSEESWAQWVKTLRPFSRDDAPNLKRHDYGWGTGTIIDSFTALYLANGSKPRTPGKYVRDEESVGPTNEQIHPTVGYRMKTTKEDDNNSDNYVPAGLKEGKVKRQPKKSGEKGWEYDINGTVLPEYVMPGLDQLKPPRFERMVLQEEKAGAYVKKLDEENGVPPQLSY